MKKTANVARVTVSLTAAGPLKAIDRQEKNRSKFVAEAVPRELDHRRRGELRKSLQNPHPESAEPAEQSIEEFQGLPDEDAEALVDSKAGKAVQWVPGEGWVEEPA